MTDGVIPPHPTKGEVGYPHVKHQNRIHVSSLVARPAFIVLSDVVKSYDNCNFENPSLSELLRVIKFDHYPGKLDTGHFVTPAQPKRLAVRLKLTRLVAIRFPDLQKGRPLPVEKFLLRKNLHYPDFIRVTRVDFALQVHTYHIWR